MEYWESSMQTGFAPIDEVNLGLAQYLVYLQNAIATGNEEFVGPMLEQIISHLEDGLPEEERLMEQMDYPLRDQHRKVHRAFIRQLRRYQGRMGAGEKVARKITYDLKVWLTNHIKLQDGDFARFSKRGSVFRSRAWLGFAGRGW